MSPVLSYLDVRLEGEADAGGEFRNIRWLDEERRLRRVRNDGLVADAVVDAAQGVVEGFHDAPLQPLLAGHFI